MTGETLTKVAQLIDALLLMDTPLPVLAVARLEAALPKSNLGLTREQEGAVGEIQLSLALWQPDSRGKPLDAEYIDDRGLLETLRQERHLLTPS